MQILRFILIIITLFMLIFNFIYGNKEEGWKVTIIFILYLLYLLFS